MSVTVEATPLARTAMAILPKGDSCVLVIFGASGDLTRRKLVPALYELSCIGCMHPQFDVLGVGRTQMTSEEFRARMRDAAAASKDVSGFTEERWGLFEERLFYTVGDVN